MSSISATHIERKRLRTTRSSQIRAGLGVDDEVLINNASISKEKLLIRTPCGIVELPTSKGVSQTRQALLRQKTY
jgi:hypothetical protein